MSLNEVPPYVSIAVCQRPAVGPGLSGSFAGGQVLEADPLTMKLSFLLCVFFGACLL